MKAEGKHALEETVRWNDGVGWIAYPDERMERSSTALAVDDDVWVIDPVDAPELDDLLAAYGEVAGVVVCLDRHYRDVETVALRHDVPVYAPTWMSGVEAEITEAPVERFGGELADTGIEVIRVRDSAIPSWQEVALYREADGTLVVPEAVGAGEFFCVGDERLGVHPMLRPFPPRRALGSLAPERVLTGHGGGVDEDATAALRDALAGSRKRAPRLYLKLVGLFV
ncbi:MAG: hypothetical protein ACOCR0_01450 [Haloferacaceae archaeon]